MGQKRSRPMVVQYRLQIDRRVHNLLRYATVQYGTVWLIVRT